MRDVSKTFPIGVFTTNTAHAGLVGLPFVDADGKFYRLVKNGSTAITYPANKVVASAIATGGGLSWVVSIPTAAKQKNIVGVIPASYGTTSIPADAYFWVQFKGPATVLAFNSLITTAGRLLYAASVLGKTRAWTIAPTWSIGGVTFARALNTVAVTAKATNSTSPTVAVWLDYVA